MRSSGSECFLLRMSAGTHGLGVLIVSIIVFLDFEYDVKALPSAVLAGYVCLLASSNLVRIIFS